MKPIVSVTAIGAAAAMLLSAGYVLGQQSAPMDYKLVSEGNARDHDAVEPNHCLEPSSLSFCPSSPPLRNRWFARL
jgi:hypothetical protein